jgi:hypothetical protein
MLAEPPEAMCMADRKARSAADGHECLVRIAAPHRTYRGHDRRVAEEMEVLGRPDIRAVWDPKGQIWRALEGSHRLWAAFEGGYGVRILSVSETGEFEHDWSALPCPAPVTDILRVLDSWPDKASYDFPARDVEVGWGRDRDHESLAARGPRM